MQIIKECQEQSIAPRPFIRQQTDTQKPWVNCFLRADSADISLESLTALFNEAKRDFPALRPKDVMLARFNALTGVGKDIAGNAGLVSYDGIQFRAPSEVPPTYRRLTPDVIQQG